SASAAADSPRASAIVAQPLLLRALWRAALRSDQARWPPAAGDRPEIHRAGEDAAAGRDRVAVVGDLRILEYRIAVAGDRPVGAHLATAAVVIDVVLYRVPGRGRAGALDIGIAIPVADGVLLPGKVGDHDVSGERIATHSGNAGMVMAPLHRVLAGRAAEIDDVSTDMVVMAIVQEDSRCAVTGSRGRRPDDIADDGYVGRIVVEVDANRLGHAGSAVVSDEIAGNRDV